MPVSSLELTNFRSYASLNIELDPVVTLVVGPNATGKTNLLEALFVLATTKSFRAKDAELIHHGEDFYRISAEIDGANIALGYKNGSSGAEKRARHDDSPKNLVDHLGHIRVVLFEPNDIQLIYGPPDRRRRYLDFILTQTDKHYVKTLHKYRRVLQQRNRLLSEWQGATAELFAWNVQLTEQAAVIDASRRRVLEHLSDHAEKLYESIAGSKEQIRLSYAGSASGNFAEGFLRALEDNLSRDIAAGFTTIGPHRDDFSIEFKHSPISSVGSRGEMRTLVLALKMAELAYIEERAKAKPLLLLDDVFSELDDSRRHFLLNSLDGLQSVITTTNADVSHEITAHHAVVRTEELQRV